MKTVTKRIVNSCKHKRCKTMTTKIKIRMTRRVVNSYSEEKGERK